MNQTAGDTRFNVENPSTREGKTMGVSQQELHYIRSPVTTPTAAAYKKRMNQSPMENPNESISASLFAPS
jgi:hypothetical protein